MSKRTDTAQPQALTTAVTKQPIRVPGMGEGGVGYGDVGRLKSSQQNAPVPGVPAPQAGQTPGAPPGGSLLFQETANPDQPVTAGAELGPGPGMEALGIPSQAPPELHHLAQAMELAIQRLPQNESREMMETYLMLREQTLQ